VTGTCWSPTAIVPVRGSLSGLGATLTRTVPAPLPLVADENDSQLVLVEKVQAHPLAADTEMSRSPPPPSIVRLLGRSSN
jgi:hypothetical protein